MFSLRSTLLTLAYLSLTQALYINTPATLTQCVPVQLSWTAATAPVYLAILKGGDASSTPLEMLPTVASGSVATWNVDLAVGTSVTVRITDSTGVVAYSSNVTIAAGTSSSCLASTSATVTTKASTTGAATGTAASVSAAAATTSKASSASSLTVSVGLGAVVGLVGLLSLVL